MENKRSYDKESFKSTPTGIRFNLEQEKIALMRSKKKTRQQLVDFLLENYVKGEPHVTENNTNKSNKQNFTPPEVNISQYEAYYNDIMLSKDLEELESIGREIQRDKNVTASEKIKLTQVGIQKAKEFE